MIGRLRGNLLSKHPPSLMVDVGGVGYELFAPMTVFYDLPEVGSEVIVYTHLAVREDAHVLYAFRSEADKTFFRQLIKVSGIGPKLALAMLSSMHSEDLASAIRTEDVARLTRIPGIGKKTAERLCVEMQDRLPEHSAGDAVPPKAQMARGNALQDATQALVGLGYKPQEISRMLHDVDTRDMNVEQIIRTALQAAVTA
ncbi:MAG: Holliday junction branch migration protein RuvA [Gammaproteobacteria bacterium]|nr:Holliday junction branch migration protein RuvA [Gammaproteobacteria bacterium]